MGKKLEYHTGFLHPDFNQVKCFLDYDNNFITAHLDEFELPEHKVFWLKWLKTQIENEPYNSIDYNTLTRNSFEFTKKYTLRMIDKDIALWESAIKENHTAQTQLKTYKTSLDLIQLEALFNQLKQHKLISSNTRFENFQKIFTNTLISDITEKIDWIGQKNLLAYFLDQLLNFQILPIETDLWAVARSCFLGADNLKQLKNNYLSNIKDSGKPINFRVIDFILERSV